MNTTIYNYCISSIVLSETQLKDLKTNLELSNIDFLKYVYLEYVYEADENILKNIINTFFKELNCIEQINFINLFSIYDIETIINTTYLDEFLKDLSTYNSLFQYDYKVYSNLFFILLKKEIINFKDFKNTNYQDIKIFLLEKEIEFLKSCSD